MLIPGAKLGAIADANGRFEIPEPAKNDMPGEITFAGHLLNFFTLLGTLSYHEGVRVAS